ncbi:MAG: hypothetical protein KDB53_18440 [Planctomycetes bacterium]|nr:hypothetical protein [Planctomycetota bacterium]
MPVPYDPTILGLSLPFQARVWASIGLFSGDNFSNGARADFGCPLGKIGDTVFCDPNGNGVQDAGEPGLPGVTVTLNCSVSGLSATTVTDNNGNYLFDNLPGGENCTVTVDPTTAPSDKVPGFNCTTEIVVALAPGQSFLNADFCFVDCGPCDGNVNALTLRYLGNVANALIQVNSGAFFSGVVQPGEDFSFSGITGSSITLTINGGSSSSIHVSCSQPIGAGSIFGDYLVVAGTNNNGGALCRLSTCSTRATPARPRATDRTPARSAAVATRRWPPRS